MEITVRREIMRYIIIIALSALTGAIFAIMEWPIEFMFIIIAIFAFISISQIIYVNSFTKNIASIEKYLAKNKKNPIFNYAYILPTATDGELIEVLEAITQKYKSTKYASIYGAYAALFKEDSEAARKSIQPIAHTEVGRYTKALIDIFEGKYEEATKHDVKKQWMQHSILAHIAFYKGDVNTLNEQAALSTNAVGGIQHYVNLHTFNKMKKELKNQP